MGSERPTISGRELGVAIAWSGLRTILAVLMIIAFLLLVPARPSASQGLLALVIVGVGVGLYVWLFRRQIRGIRRSRYPTIRSVEALVVVAVMFLALFAAVYVLISVNDPSAFTETLDHFTAYYFALTVLATVGFGDITPVSDLARTACMLQMAIDIAFVGVLVKVLGGVARKTSDARAQAESAAG